MTSSPQARPWAAISPQIAEVLRPVLPRLAEEILEQVAGELPMLGRDLAGPYGVALKAGVEQALEHFLGLLGADRPALDERLRNLYESFGAREDKHGRTLEILLAAYRRGARGAWEHFSRAALDADVPTQDVVRLAEAIFAYIEELSHASAVGFAQEHSDRAGRRNLVRQQLGEVLLFEGAATAPARVAELAAEAGWA
ncbi:MAG: PucR family transcriptional regulator, partial [Candidatus Lutibacillus vidarii]